jgi:hypothetical protein
MLRSTVRPLPFPAGNQPLGQIGGLVDWGLDSGRVIRLPEGEFLFSEVASRLELNEGERFSLIGAGSHKTKIKLTSDAAGYFLTLRCDGLPGPEEVTWPNGRGTEFFTSSPTTKLTANVEPGLWNIQVVDTTGIEVGALVAIKCLRLFARTDHRNSCMFGELNRVSSIVSGTELALEKRTEFGYRNSDLVYTGTAASGTDSTIVLAGGHGLNLDQVDGCRITITGGTGAGQVRYCSSVIGSSDGLSDTLVVDTVSNRLQYPFDPAPDNTSEFTLDAPTYVTAYNDPFSCHFEGFTLDVYAVPGTNTAGLSIGEAYRPVVRDVWIEGAKSTALRMRQCYEPRIEYLRARDATNDSLGYGTVLSGCRDGYDFARITHGCRRGTDATGDYPSIGCTIDGSYVVQAGGDVFIGGTTGLGSHGGSHRTKFKNTVFIGGDGGAGMLIRGSQETIDGLHIEGPVGIGISLYYGNGTKIKNVEWNGLTIPTSYPTVPAPTDNVCLVAVSPTYSGDITIDGVQANAAMNSLVFFAQDFALAADKRVKGDFSVRNVDVRNPATGTFYVVDADGDFIPEPGTWWIDRDSIRVNMTEGGTYRLFANIEVGNAGPPTISSSMRLGGKTWMVTLKDGELITLPAFDTTGLTRSVKLWDAVFDSVLTLPVHFNGVIRDGSTASVDWSTASAQMEILDGPFVIGDVTTAKFAVGYDAEKLYFGNKVGRTVTVYVEF